MSRYELQQAAGFATELFCRAAEVIPSFMEFDVRLVMDPARTLPTPTVELHVRHGARLERGQWPAKMIASTHSSVWGDMIQGALDQARRSLAPF